MGFPDASYWRVDHGHLCKTRKGRKSGLTLSVSLMCVGSLIIACAPTYASVGMLHLPYCSLPVYLQGLSVGGEHG